MHKADTASAHDRATTLGRPGGTTRPVDLLFAVLSGLLSVLMVGWLVYWSGRGLDFTDEGFYLNWSAHPEDQASAVSLFGYAYHPWYMLLDADLHALRLVNVVLTWVLSAALAWLLLARPELSGHLAETRPFLRASFAAAMASISLLQFSQGLLTPNYNTLTYQAMVLTCIGVVLGLQLGRSGVAGWVLAGAGGWLVFLAKPTSALVLALLVPLIALIECRRRILTTAVAMAGGLLVAAGVTLAGYAMTPTDLVNLLSRGVEIAEALGEHHLTAMFRLDPFVAPPVDTVMTLVLTCGAVVLMAALGWRDVGPVRVVFGFWLLGLAVATVLTVERALDGELMANRDSIQVFLVMAAVFVVVVVPFRESVDLSIGRRVVWILFLAVLPFVYTLGTNNNQVTGAARAGFFVLAAAVCGQGLAAGASGSTRRVQPMLAAAQVLTVLVVVSIVVHPYRQDDLRTATSSVQVAHGSSRSTLQVSDDTRQLLVQIAETVEHAGINRSVGVIDLTGKSPGIIYAMNARALGQAWLIGGYPGSPAAAALALEDVACAELRRAYVLDEPAGPRRIPPTVVEHVGLSFPDGYEVVSEIATPRIGALALYRPVITDQPVQNCRG